MLARTRGINKLEIGVDLIVVATSCVAGEEGTIVGWSLMQNIRCLLRLDEEVQVSHIFREANKCVDALTNMMSEGIFLLYL
jgi:hypothetical protein